MRWRPSSAVSRWLWAAAALALAAALGAAEVADRRDRSALVAKAHRLGLTSPGLARDLTWAADSDRARLTLASALITAGMGPEGGPPPEQVAARPRFQAAAQLAREVLGRRPASWEAAGLTGAAIYLDRSLARDPLLLQDYPAWEQPLLLAERLAPDRDEPKRFLALAYLELWPALSPAKQARARELTAIAFRNLDIFYRVAEPWLATVGDGPEALAAVPRRPEAWAFLADLFARQGRATAYCHAREQELEAHAVALEDRLADARGRRRVGAARDARARYFTAIAAVPTDVRFVPPVERALAEVPHGTADPALTPALERWLVWSHELAAITGRAPLSHAAFDRLASAAAVGPAEIRALTPVPHAGWTAAGHQHRRILSAPTTARGLQLTLQVPGGEAPVSVRLDGTSLGCQVARHGVPLNFAVEVEAGPHWLELDYLSSAPVYPAGETWRP